MVIKELHSPLGLGDRIHRRNNWKKVMCSPPDSRKGRWFGQAAEDMGCWANSRPSSSGVLSASGEQVISNRCCGCVRSGCWRG